MFGLGRLVGDAFKIVDSVVSPVVAVATIPVTVVAEVAKASATPVLVAAKEITKDLRSINR